MACQLNLQAIFQDVSSIRSFLFPSIKSEAVSSKKDQGDDENWDDADWGWKDEEADEEWTMPNDNLSWLQDCHISISPTSELMAIGHNDRLILLSQKWDPKEASEVQTKYSSIFEDRIGQENREQITCVQCLPLASQKRSTHGGPDWTCVMVGFSSGYVRMYTENGSLLLSQIFNEEPVISIKCCTYEPPRHSTDSERHEEVTILYRRALVTIDGFSFFQSLRACRNQVARATASGNELIQPPPLAYKKYALQAQDKVNQHVSCGMSTPNAFDQMKTASVMGGHKATIKATPPASQTFVTAGVVPYIGFFSAMEGSTQPMLSDVAHAVASKLKSALFSQISAASGWLGFSSKPTSESKEKEKPKIEPATTIPMRYSLSDKRRHGEAIHLSPDNRLAAVTDSFGRVMLLDVTRGIAVRMWKGYRDAQIGWVEVKEDLHPEKLERNPHKQFWTSSEARRALFLIIYAPRRGILEVWTSQAGPRVAAFNVSKHCQLLCPSHSMMGLNNVSCRNVRLTIYHCFLVDPDSGIKVLEIPFHLALSDKNSKRARDLHMLKKLKTLLKDNEKESGSLQTGITETLLDIRISSMRQQGLERVLHTKYLSAPFLMAVIQAVIHQLKIQADENEAAGWDYESRMLLQFCEAEEKLLQMFNSIESMNDVKISAQTKPSDQEVATQLGLTTSELEILKDQIENYHSTLDSIQRVQFIEETQLTASDFLACFECHLVANEELGNAASMGGGSRQLGDEEDMDVGQGLKSPASGSHLQVRIKPLIPDARLDKLGNFFFKRGIVCGTFKDLASVFKHSGVEPEELLSLLLHVWLAEERRSLHTTRHFSLLIKLVSSLKDPESVSVEHNTVSTWWQKMRERCVASENIGTALMAAVVGRSVAANLSNNHHQAKYKAAEEKDDSFVVVNWAEWETVSLDCTQWTVVVKQLEVLLELQCLVKMKLDKEQITTSYQPVLVSVQKVLSGGKGVLPEVVAKWIAGHGILPGMLTLAFHEETIEDKKRRIQRQTSRQVSQQSQHLEAEEEGMEVDEEDVDEMLKAEPPNPIVVQLQKVQKRLPLSLDSDVLMANCSWEYILQWRSDMEVVFPLQQAVAFLKCIQNPVIQHGIGVMMWQMFIVKKLSSAAYLMEKVGKVPKERLCRRDTGLSDVSLHKFLEETVELADTILQASGSNLEPPMFHLEDLWQNVQGPTSLVELAVEQKETNIELAEHHFHLATILYAIMTFSFKSIKPLSLFDTKGRNAFFKPLQSNTMLPGRIVDDSIQSLRRQFLCRIITQSVLSLGEKSVDTPISSTCTSTATTPGTPPSVPIAYERTVSTVSSALSTGSQRGSVYFYWPGMARRLAKDLGVEVDCLRRQQVCDLYSSGLDKMAEEALLTVSDHSVMGSQLMLIAGQRIAHFIYSSEPDACVAKVSKCPPKLSTWLSSLDRSELRCKDCPVSETATLVGHVINQLVESHTEYKMAIALVELVHEFL